MCIIHRWFYAKSSNGVKHPVTGKFLKREDRICMDCDKMQLNSMQFSLEQRKELAKLAKCSLLQQWVTYVDGDAIDKLTWKWLKLKPI